MEKANKKKSKLVLILKWIGGLIGFLLIFMFAVPNIFDDYISSEIKKGLNEHLKTELQFKESDVSFFRHFPALTFSFEEVHLAGSEPFSDEPLITAKELGFGINVLKLVFSKELEIDKTYLTDCNIRLLKNKFGENNYDVYREVDATTIENDTSSVGINLNLDRLVIKNTTVFYKDEDIGISIISNGLNYRGKGGMDAGILEIGSNLEIDSIDVVFDKVEYLKGKKLRAKSFTVYNTNTLSIKLDDNNISLNDLNINFKGKLDVFDEGMAYNFDFSTQDGTIQGLVSALPPEYVEWSKEMDFKGKMDATLNLAGYTGSVPDSLKRERMAIVVDIENGRIAHKGIDQVLDNLFLKFNGSIENDWMDIRLDSLNFKLKDELTTGKLVLKGRKDSLYIKSNVTSKIDLTTLNQTLPLPGLKFNGLLASNWNAEGVYQPSASKLPKTKGSFKLMDGYLQTSRSSEPIKNITLDAEVINNGNTFSESTLTINDLNFDCVDNHFSANAFIKNFDQPEYRINCVANIDFPSLHKVVDLPFVLADGTLVANLKLQGHLNNPDSADLQNSITNSHTGMLDIKNIQIETDALLQPMLISEGRFLFQNGKMAFSKLNIQHGSSKLEMDGFFQNYLDYMFFSKGILRGDVNLKSSKIDITEFFPKEDLLNVTSTQAPRTDGDNGELKESLKGVMLVPKDLDLALQIQIDTLKYNALYITTLSGALGIREETLLLKNGNLKMVEGSARLDGFYRPIDTQKALFSMDLKAEHLDIEKGYESIELFKELVPAAEHASGQVSLDYNLSGTIDNQMMPVLPSLEGKGTLKAYNVQFEDYKLFGTIAKESGFDKLKDPALSEITINSSVKNNILTLERFKFKISPFRLRTEGQTTLDGKLNLKIRVGLPPLGIIGIPVVVTGTSDAMNIKLGKKSPNLEELEIDESGYSEQELQRMRMLKDSIREGMTVDQINKMQQKIETMNLDSLRTQSIDSLRSN